MSTNSSCMVAVAAVLVLVSQPVTPRTPFANTTSRAAAVAGGDPADRRNAQKSGFVDVHDDQADLVHVGRKHHAPAALPLAVHDQVAERVTPDGVGMGSGIALNAGSDGVLTAGGAVAEQQILEHLFKHFHSTS